MKIVTAFDLGVLIARSNFVKNAENPLVGVTAQHFKDNSNQAMNAYQQNKNRPAPLNIPGAAANAFSGLGSAIRTGAQMAASPPQLPSWALNYKPNAPQTTSTAPAYSPRIATSRQTLPSYGAGGDPLDPLPPPPVDAAREANNAYHQNLVAQRKAREADPFNLNGTRPPIDMTNPANAYAMEMIRQRMYRAPNVARR